MKKTIEIGNKVERIAASTDYTNGRKGEVIEVNETDGRARVLWTEEKSGSPVTNSTGKVGLRTWVKFSALKVII